eukprot:CAMPEP_0174905644 /NCGR_PEP_ID=MMETSP0167-20121228/53733_1 /TAXON_ID=38298 /ORGANISM="Rhodella maculata, Strain CCMP736" /LENGTH=62 /DNA_ID=CAMNT_0016148643 /DNA_START=100 /DNA_END=288 /DNA_ORIENTATION=-
MRLIIFGESSAGALLSSHSHRGNAFFPECCTVKHTQLAHPPFDVAPLRYARLRFARLLLSSG